MNHWQQAEALIEKVGGFERMGELAGKLQMSSASTFDAAMTLVRKRGAGELELTGSPAENFQTVYEKYRWDR